MVVCGGCCLNQANTMQAVVDEGSTAQPSIDQQSLYDKLGGRPALQAAVNVFYDKMLADPRVSHFFDGLDMRVQRAHQVAFMSFALGGTKAFSGRSMQAAHERLAAQQGMRMEHFDIVLEHLGAALHELGVPEADIAGAAAAVNTLRPDFQAVVDKALMAH